MVDPKDTPREPRLLAEVGGAVDRSSATLAVYGKDLIPNHVTALLGIEPTDSFQRGFKPGPRSPAMPHGAWFLEVQGAAPAGPETQIETLISRLPDSADIWRQLNERYTVQLRLALHMESWNRGYRLNKKLIERLAALGVDLEFDLYTDVDPDAWLLAVLPAK